MIKQGCNNTIWAISKHQNIFIKNEFSNNKGRGTTLRKLGISKKGKRAISQIEQLDIINYSGDEDYDIPYTERAAALTSRKSTNNTK